MTSEQENAIRTSCRQCTEEIRKAMRIKPKPNWNATVPPIIKKHHQKIPPSRSQSLGVRCYNRAHEWALWS